MRRKKSTAAAPKKRPELFDICFRPREAGQGFAGNKGEVTLGMRRRQRREARLQFKQKHQPMRLTRETFLADQAREMEIVGLKREAKLLTSLASRTGMGGFSVRSVEFAAGRAPKSFIGGPHPMEEKDLIPLIEAVKQRGNLVRQTHRRTVIGIIGLEGKTRVASPEA
jgi:hypothetical protein